MPATALMDMPVPEVMEQGFEVSDVTGQKVLNVSDVPPEATVGELIDGLIGRMKLPSVDGSGRPLVFRARLEREGRHLFGSERVAEVIRPGDRLVLQPNIDAGAPYRTTLVR